MTKFAWDVPGYVQGHRFSDDPRYWNGTNFRDLAGYSQLGNDVQLVAGTPAFSGHGTYARRGLLLNNSNTYKFHTAVPWEGSMLFVIKPQGASSSSTLYPWLFGCVTAETSNGNVRLLMTLISGQGTLAASTPSVALYSPLAGIPFNTIAICAYSFNQNDRMGRATRDGVTIATVGPAAGTSNGNGVAIGGTSAPGVIPDIGGVSHDYVRMGDNVGDGSLTPNATDYLYVFEQHFWKDDVLLNNPTQLAALIADLKVYYGI